MAGLRLGGGAVLDLCHDLSEREVIDLVTRSIQTGRTSAVRLLMVLRRRERCAHRSLLNVLLTGVADGAESPLELSYLDDVERRHRLPVGRRQVRSGTTRRDVVDEQFATVVELDGQLGHQGLGRFRDMHRDNRSALVGDQTLRFGWHDVRGDPCGVAAIVGTVLSLRGWSLAAWLARPDFSVPPLPGPVTGRCCPE